MGKRLIAIGLMLCLFLSGLSVGAEGLTGKLLTAMTEISRDIVVPALPFMSDDDGLDMLQEALDKVNRGEDGGILGSVITQALQYTDAETLQNGIDSLRVLDESFRRKCHDIYQRCEGLSLNNEEEKGAQVLLGFLTRKDPEFETALNHHQISTGMVANFMNAVTMLTGGASVFSYDGDDFSVKTYPSALIQKLDAIWQPTKPDFDLRGYLDRSADTLNTISAEGDRSAVASVMKRAGILEVKASKPEGGGNGGATGGTLIPDIPESVTGAYETMGALPGFEDAVLTFNIKKEGRTIIPGNFTEPVVYQVVDSTLKPVKMALLIDGKIVADLKSGIYVVREESPYFTDVSGWAQKYIEALYARDIVGGKAPGLFMPNDSITREEFVKLVTELFDMVDGNATTSFEDVQPGAWYYPYVASAQKSGIVGGVSGTEFGIGAKIKRQDMAKIICDVLKKKGVTMVPADASVFADYEEIADYAKEQVLSVYQAGIISGDDMGNFNPNQFATRAEASKMVYGMLLTVLLKG